MERVRLERRINVEPEIDIAEQHLEEAFVRCQRIGAVAYPQWTMNDQMARIEVYDVHCKNRYGLFYPDLCRSLCPRSWYDLTVVLAPDEFEHLTPFNELYPYYLAHIEAGSVTPQELTKKYYSNLVRVKIKQRITSSPDTVTRVRWRVSNTMTFCSCERPSASPHGRAARSRRWARPRAGG